MITKKNPRKNETKIRLSNLVKQKSWYIDLYDGATTKEQVELLKKDLKFVIEYSYFSTPLSQTNRHQKAEVGNPVEILENHQSIEI